MSASFVIVVLVITVTAQALLIMNLRGKYERVLGGICSHLDTTEKATTEVVKNTHDGRMDPTPILDRIRDLRYRIHPEHAPTHEEK